MNWYAIFSAIITLLCAVITSVVYPLIKAKIGNENLKSIEKWVKIAVEAVEMIYTESGLGTTKKEDVVNFINEYLASKNINMSYEEIDKLIESAVKELKLKESACE